MNSVAIELIRNLFLSNLQSKFFYHQVYAVPITVNIINSFFLECPTGTFGLDCGYNCSGHCIDDIPCDKTTGRCDSGCKPGYTGELCDTGLINCKIDKMISKQVVNKTYFSS